MCACRFASVCHAYPVGPSGKWGLKGVGDAGGDLTVFYGRLMKFLGYHYWVGEWRME